MSEVTKKRKLNDESAVATEKENNGSGHGRSHGHSHGDHSHGHGHSHGDSTGSGDLVTFSEAKTGSAKVMIVAPWPPPARHYFTL